MTWIARWAAKGEDLYWNGYKVHITETCDDPPDPTPTGQDTASRDAATTRVGSGRTSSAKPLR
jgi:hypothetical protein